MAEQEDRAAGGGSEPSGPGDRIVAGVVTAFDKHRGLGEIEAGGTRYPFHCTQIADGTRDIPVGARVEFTVAPGPLGRWEAVAVRPSAAGSSAGASSRA